MKPISDLFDGLVIFVSQGTVFKDPQLAFNIANHGGLVVRNVNNKVGYVVCDENDTSKEVLLAETYADIKLISEQFFTDSIAIKSLRNESSYYVRSSKGASSSSTSTAKGKAASASASSSSAPKAKQAKGPAVPPVDPQSLLAASAHVLEEKGDFWTATLNLTDFSNNHNKYYKIQLLESNSNPKVYHVWTGWGRVGYSGQSKLSPFNSNLKGAKNEFEKKFLDKTGNDWSDHKDFQAISGKYTLIELALGESEDENDDDDSAPAPVAPAASSSKPAAKAAASATSTSTSSGLGLTNLSSGSVSMLDPRIQDFVQMIFDKKMMANTVAAMNFDVAKSPLGKLSKSTIKKGYAVLKEIADVLQAQPGKKGNPKLMDLSNRFYTYIPHSAGMARLPPIDSETMLKEKLALLETLLDVEIAEKLKKDEEANTADAGMHPIDRKYKSLGIKLAPVERSEEIFGVLEKFVYNTHAPTHTQYSLKVLDIIEVDRPTEAIKFPKCSDSISNHQLLWHGSRMSNWVGILSQGLRIAPPEAPVTGYMFGKGVYFADLSSKSANYCHASSSDPIGVLLVCEVALGQMLNRTKADYITSLPSGYHSVCGLGTSEPDPATFHMTPDGVKVPYGKPQKNPNVDYSELLYNEFIVYDVDQIKMKYLIKIRFNYK